MKPWQLRLEERLRTGDAPAVLSRDLLARMARGARGGEDLPASSLTHWIRAAAKNGRLQPVVRGLYLNRWRARPAALADAAAWLRADAVVSLNTVLAEAGALNNPTHIVTAVVPLDAGAPPPRLGRQATHAGSFQFHGLPRRILEAGAPEDRLEPAGAFDHARATPEKALVDWLYLAASPRSTRHLPPRGDVDVDRLKRSRLRALARAAGVTDVLDTWLNRKPD
ncbi:MAG TPA: hypothetical protein VFV77_07650 [Gammaproteobacteria bacterium]|nr:hypothetical protein [Gammaproteobacteria bacterium]